MARDWLKKIREERGLSQAEVAKQVGIVQQSYQTIEKGATDPEVRTAKQIGAVLGFPWPRLFEDEDSKEASNIDP